MTTTEQHLKRIQDKLQLLLKQHTALEKENTRLKDELEKKNQHASLQQQSVEELKQQVNVLKLNAGDMNAADKKELEKRINVYLKEIDRVIAMLGQ